MRIRSGLALVVKVFLMWAAFAVATCLGVLIWTSSKLVADDFFTALRYTAPSVAIFALALTRNRKSKPLAAPPRT